MVRTGEGALLQHLLSQTAFLLLSRLWPDPTCKVLSPSVRVGSCSLGEPVQ